MATGASDRKLFSSLMERPTAPQFGFSRFLVGNSMQNAWNTIAKLVNDMLKEEQDSSFRLIIGANGNGKTLLNHKIRDLLSSRNLDIKEQELGVTSIPKFESLYSHVLDLAGQKGQESIEILYQLRRSEIEAPVHTYNLIALRIIQDFGKKYKPPRWVRLSTLGLTTFLRLGTLAMLDQVDKIESDLAKALKDDAEGRVDSTLGAANALIQKLMTKKDFREKLVSEASDLQIGGFVEVYFGQGKPVSASELRKRLAKALDDAKFLNDPRGVVNQIYLLGRKVNAKLIVIMVDDCNYEDFAYKMLPLLSDISNFHNPKVAIMISMVEGVARNLKNSSDIDETLRQKLFYGKEIELHGPTRGDIEILYDRLRSIFNDGYGMIGRMLPDDRALREEIVSDWERKVSDPTLAKEFKNNFRTAMGFLARSIEREASSRKT